MEKFSLVFSFENSWQGEASQGKSMAMEGNARNKIFIQPMMLTRDKKLFHLCIYERWKGAEITLLK